MWRKEKTSSHSHLKGFFGLSAPFSLLAPFLPHTCHHLCTTYTWSLYILHSVSHFPAVLICCLSSRFFHCHQPWTGASCLLLCYRKGFDCFLVFNIKDRNSFSLNRIFQVRAGKSNSSIRNKKINWRSSCPSGLSSVQSMTSSFIFDAVIFVLFPLSFVCHLALLAHPVKNNVLFSRKKYCDHGPGSRMGASCCLLLPSLYTFRVT